MAVGTPYRVAADLALTTNTADASITLNATANAGDTLFVCVAQRLASVAPIVSVTGHGSTRTPEIGVSPSASPASTRSVSFYRIYLTSAVSTGAVLTVTLSNTTPRKNVFAFAVPGLADTNVNTTPRVTNDTQGSPSTVSTNNPTLADAVAIAFYRHDATVNTETGTPATGWTEIGDKAVGASSWSQGYIQYKVLSTATAQGPVSYTPSGGVSSTQNWESYLGIWVGQAGIAAPTNLTVPTITGVAQVGQVLSTDSGTWDNGGDTNMALSYKWQHYTGSAWILGSGVGNTSTSYTEDITDLGMPMRVQVTATNSASTSGIKAQSVATANVIAAGGGGGGISDPVIASGIADGARTNSTSQTFTWTDQTGVTWWTQLDNNAWVNQGVGTTTVTYTNLHGTTQHRFRLMGVLNGAASRIATRTWDIFGIYNRPKFYTGTESCLVIPINFSGSVAFSGTAPNTNKDSLKILVVPLEQSGLPFVGTTSQWATNLAKSKALIEAMSWGQLTITYTLIAKQAIAAFDVTNQALVRKVGLKALQKSGIDYTGYDVIHYYISNSVNGGGLTYNFGECVTLGDPLSTSLLDVQKVAHENCHALGMTHDGGLTQFPFSGATTLDAEGALNAGGEYFNPYSIMGANSIAGNSSVMGQPTMMNRWLAGLCRGSQVSQVSSGGAKTLSARELASAPNPQALVMKSNTGVEYWVEYVKPGVDQAHDLDITTASPSLTQPSVLIYARMNALNQHTPLTTGTSRTYLVYPAGAGAAENMGFVNGDTFTDGTLTIAIGVLGTNAAVTVTNPVAPGLPTAPDYTRPGQVNTLVMDSSSDSTHVVLRWTLPTNANNKTIIYRDGAIIASIAAGVSTYTDPIAVGETHDYAVQTQRTYTLNGNATTIQSPPSNLVTNAITPSGTVTSWQQQLATINAFYNENSYGQFQFAFSMIPAVTITKPVASGTFVSDVMSRAAAAAVTAGFNPTDYLHVYYMPPVVTEDTTIGLTNVITNPTLTDTYENYIPNGLDPTYIYGLNASCHELGHTLGFSHANALNCGTVTLNLTTLAAAEADSNGLSGNIEYGNTTSTMGRGQLVP